MMKILGVLVAVLLSVSSTAIAQAPCDLQGAWELVSAKYDNQPAPATFKGIKKIIHSAPPDLIGLSLLFQCQREGDRLIQKGTIPNVSGGKKVGDVALEEVWRRVERP